MTRFSVRVLRRAEQDADRIFNWLADRSPTGAARWYATFLAATTTIGLATDPLRYEVAPESATLGREVRQRFFKTKRGRIYRLLFVVVETVIRVLTVRGPGQAAVTAEDVDL